MNRRSFLKTLGLGTAAAVVSTLVQDEAEDLARIGLAHPGRTYHHVLLPAPAWDAARVFDYQTLLNLEAYLLHQGLRPPAGFAGFEVKVPGERVGYLGSLCRFDFYGTGCVPEA